MAERSSSIRLQLETIQTSTDRSHAYSLLLQLHRLSIDNPSIMESILIYSPLILPRILADSHCTDEEIGVMAVKCLGFVLYHPSLVASLSDEMAQMALDSINKLIISTSMKAVCNLGVWCLSVQQLNTSVIKSRIDSLINAITYAINNPFGSLSVTYEATQAVIKLASQIPEEMKHSSEMWAPQIYRRLLSSNKTEYDTAQRCLHKISSVILPPKIILCKQVASDLKRNMLESMVDLVHDDQKKTQGINVWGWFISLLGFESKHLINKMLKIVEKTFTDRDPQVQIAALVSWRHLIDAIQPEITNYTNKMLSDVSIRSLIKKLKLILIPLKGIMSNKCHLSVHNCSFNTWCYFLHKIDFLINQRLILEDAFGSILEAIFSIGSEMPLWNSCIDLFHEYISTNTEKDGSNNIKATLLAEYSIKWVPWDLTYLDFHLRIIGFITNVEKLKDISVENRILALKAGLKIFRSLLKGVRNELKSSKACENTKHSCIKSILKFIKEICEANWCDESLKVCVEFIRAVLEELETPVFDSSLYKISLDIDYIKELQNIKPLNSRNFSSLGIREICYMDLVSPIEYLILLYFSTGIHIMKEISEEYIRFLDPLFSVSKLRNFEYFVSLMFMEIRKPSDERFNLLRIWNYLAKDLNKHIIHILRQDSENYTFNVVYGFLIYPLFLFISTDNTRNPLNDQNEANIEFVTGSYKSLNEYFNQDLKSRFCEGLCEMLVGFIDENNGLLVERIENCGISKSRNNAIFSIIGEITIQILENNNITDLRNKEGFGHNKECSHIKNRLMLISRFFKLLILNLKSNQEDEHRITNKVFAALIGLVAQFVLRKDILLLFEVLSDPLSQVMLSCTNTHHETNQPLVQNLENLWTQVLDCLKINQQLIALDSSLFKTHSSLFQTALNNPHLSAATSVFFKSDKLSPHNNASSFEDFEALSERFGVSALKKGVKEGEETGFVNISTGLKRKRLEITKYTTKGKEPNQIGSVFSTRSRVSLNNGLESKDTRKPEDILQMLKRK